MWNYAKLSKLAKVYGGPEELVNILVKHGAQEGLKKGRLQMIPVAILAGILGFSVKPIYNYFKGKKARSIAECEAARAELIQGIKDYDAKHQEEDFRDSQE